LNGPGAVALVQRLTAQVLVEPAQEGGHMFTLAEHLRDRIPAIGGLEAGAADGSGVTVQVTEQVAGNQTEQVPPLVQLSTVQWLIVNNADTPRKLQDLMEVAGYKQRPFFKATHLEPLLAAGVLRMTVPDKPRSSNQQYVLTEAGVKLKALHGKAGPEQVKRKSKK
jgi:ATP-dependent DNA helicase RecG